MPSRTPPPSRFRVALAACLCCLGLAAAGAGAGAGGYTADFSRAEVGKPPPDAQVVGGAFAVAEFDGGKVLELPGNPLETFGLLFGPAGQAEATVAARVYGESTGKRFPEFGVGAGDVGGYRLLLLPGQKRLELRLGDDPVAEGDYAGPWVSGGWTELRLRLRKAAEGKWLVEGKAWPSGAAEPQRWAVAFEATEPPPAGRASVWGVPFSGRPIRFDDLAVRP